MKATYDIVKNKAKIINEVLKENDPELIPVVKKAVSKVKVDNVIRDKMLIDQP